MRNLIIEKTLLMTLQKLICFTAFIGSVSFASVYAQSGITACNGKNYNVGDTLVLGKRAISGYLGMREIDDTGSLSSVYDKDLSGTKTVITSIPEYDKKLYEDMGLYGEQDALQLVMAEGNGKRYCISLNFALTSGNIMSDYKVSSVEGYSELSPSILYVYALKLYKKTIDDSVVDKYASLCVPEEFAQSSSDPSALDELRKTYRNQLQQELSKADFSRVFRIKCLSELKPYDMTKECFPLSGFSCIDVNTNQDNALSQLSYCLWEECAFHFSNASSFNYLPSEKSRAKGFYDMRRYANKSDSPVATLYVYVKIKNQPVKLPEKKIMMTEKGDGFDFYWTTLNKAYGDRSLDMEIIHVDGYYNIFPSLEGDVDYNYLGSLSK